MPFVRGSLLCTVARMVDMLQLTHIARGPYIPVYQPIHHVLRQLEEPDIFCALAVYAVIQ
jgi:hypothetical protein